jgi:hypothetical protein
MIKTIQTNHVLIVLDVDDWKLEEVLTRLHRHNLMCGANAEENENTKPCHPRVVRKAKDQKDH